jgi:hypothetical protein
MRLDTDMPKAALTKLRDGLRSSRLWPLALVLLVAIVAVPIALSKSSSGTPIASAPPSIPPPAGTSLPALNVQSTPGHSKLPGHGRDPFAGKGSGQSTTQSSSSSATSSPSTTGSGTTSGGAGAGSASTSSSSAPAGSGSTSASPAPPSSSHSAPPSITSGEKPTSAPSGLAGDQAYDVTLTLTDPSGGLDTIDSLERLSVLPNAANPLLVELGVLQGGKRVLFAVSPGTVVSGPGTCTPGPIDCEILSLGQEQTEGVSLQSAGGPRSVALFAVTGIVADRYSSAAAADADRRQQSQAGRQLLNLLQLDALSLFRYEPSVGAVVDLRNLTAGDVR